MEMIPRIRKGSEHRNFHASPGAETLPRSYLVDAGFVLLIALLCCLFFRDILIYPDYIVNFNDLITQHYPWRYFTKNPPGGVSPLWLPFPSGGEPYLANPQVALFYPIDRTLLFILPTHLALGYGIVFHFFLAGVFMYCLAVHLVNDRLSSLASATTFMFSQYLIAQMYAGHYVVIAAAAWIPLVFLLAKLAIDNTNLLYGLLTATSLAAQMLAGHTQTTVLTVFLVGLYAFLKSIQTLRLEKSGRRALLPFLILGASIVVSISLAAVQLLPTYEFLRETTRASGLNSYWFSTIYSLPFHSITGILLPNLFGTPINESYINMGPYWEFALYIGVLPPILIIVLFSLRRSTETSGFFLTVAILSLILALGKYTPFYWLLWKFVPFYDSFRVPARFLILFTLSTAVLTGMGLKALRAELTNLDHQRLRVIIKSLFGLTLLLLSGALVAYAAMEPIIGLGERVLTQVYDWHPHPMQPYEWYHERLRPAYLSAMCDTVSLAALTLGSLTVLLWRVWRANSSYFVCIAAAVLIFTNLWIYHSDFVELVKLTEIYREPGHVQFLKRHVGEYRVYDRDSLLRHNLQIVYGLHTLRGRNLFLKNYHSVLTALENSDLRECQGLLNALNVKYVITRKPAKIEWLNEVYHEGEVYIYENTTVLPKVFAVEERENRLNSVLKRNWAAIDNDNQLTLRKPIITVYTPNEIVGEVELKQSGVLVLSETYYPGWRAYVDGVEQEILEIDGAFRGIRVDKGKHVVRFIFEPESLRWGTYISGAATGLLACGLGVLGLRRNGK